MVEIKGLTEEEVLQSREKYGTNQILENKQESFFKKFLGNFKDPMIKILSLCCILLLILAVVMPDKVNIIEPVSIAVAILLATFVSTLNEYSSGKKFKNLQDEANNIQIKVYRDGTIKEISIDDIVAGDYVSLQLGDRIPADGFVVKDSFKIDNSVLNGESEENKKEPISEGKIEDLENKIDFTHPNKVYRGAVVCDGEGVMKVSKVGMNTVNGVMMQQMDVKETPSPLQEKLAELAKRISKIGYAGAALIGITNFIFVSCIQNNASTFFTDNSGEVLKLVIDSIIFAIIIIVMAVPEGLPLMIAIVLSQNMQKMLKDNVLVRKLVGIETAGSLNLLYSDKTGTITKGKLEVILFQDGNFKEYTDNKDIPDRLRELVNMSVSSNTSSMIAENGEIIGGNATERAILKYIDADEINDEIQIKNKLAFNSANKYSATELNGDTPLTLYKGAPERILDKCTAYYDEAGNKKPFSETERQKMSSIIDELAKKSIRVISLATSDEPLDKEKLPENKTLVGIVGIRDDVRPEAVDAIREVKTAGIQVIMITGDRKETAVAIARDSGLLQSDDEIVLTSDELQNMPDDEVKKILPKIRVISRALPMDKYRLVNLSQELGLVTGMTGDGANDAPALKKSDVGFAMGSGTEVSKEAGDIIILDDNFKSIEKAVLYGRTIYNNIQKFLKFQLNINVAAVLISVIAPFLGIHEPLKIIQILWINMIMDTLAALALGGEPALQYYMEEKPKKRSDNIVPKDMMKTILFTGIWTTVIGILFLKLPIFHKIFNVTNEGGHLNTEVLLTGFFCFFVFTALFNGFNVRSNKTDIFKNLHLNPNFMKIMVLVFTIQVIIVYIGGKVFETTPLNLTQWIVVLILSILIIPVDLLRKKIMKTND